MPNIYQCEIIKNTLMTDTIYSITIKSPEIARAAVAGQFLHIKCGQARILRRPISISSVQDDNITFVFEVKGEGTGWLSAQKPEQMLDILGPLGNGYKIPEDKIIVVGGGLGTPPMLFTAQSAKNNVTAILGFRSASRVIMVDDFIKVCEKVYVTTDDGSAGIRSAVTDPLEELLKSGNFAMVMSCGQLLMQKAVAKLCGKYGAACQVSLEERMGCGVGACLVCACETKFDGTMQMSRVCADGPVFFANNIDW